VRVNEGPPLSRKLARVNESQAKGLLRTTLLESTTERYPDNDWIVTLQYGPDVGAIWYSNCRLCAGILEIAVSLKLVSAYSNKMSTAGFEENNFKGDRGGSVAVADETSHVSPFHPKLTIRRCSMTAQ